MRRTEIVGLQANRTIAAGKKAVTVGQAVVEKAFKDPQVQQAQKQLAGGVKQVVVAPYVGLAGVGVGSTIASLLDLRNGDYPRAAANGLTAVGAFAGVGMAVNGHSKITQSVDTIKTRLADDIDGLTKQAKRAVGSAQVALEQIGILGSDAITALRDQQILEAGRDLLSNLGNDLFNVDGTNEAVTSRELSASPNSSSVE